MEQTLRSGLRPLLALALAACAERPEVDQIAQIAMIGLSKTRHPRLPGRAGRRRAVGAGDRDLDLSGRRDDDRYAALGRPGSTSPLGEAAALRRPGRDDQRPREPGGLRVAGRRRAAVGRQCAFAVQACARGASASAGGRRAMSRAERLLELMQTLRRRRAPVAGAALAEELGVSLRTLYRDIASLQAQGAAIEGEAGFGYVLKPGFTLPPLMFTLDEVEALALGARWVEGRADAGLARAARDALAKIAAVLPPERADALDWPTLLAGAGQGGRGGERRAAGGAQGARGGAQARLRLCGQGRARRRTGSSGRSPSASSIAVRMLAAWCETREAFRHFRLDRMAAVAVLDERRRRPAGRCSGTGGGPRGSRDNGRIRSRPRWQAACRRPICRKIVMTGGAAARRGGFLQPSGSP